MGRRFKTSNKGLGHNRENKYVYKIWLQNSGQAYRMPLSRAGFPKVVFVEKFAEMYKRNNDHVVLPLDVLEFEKGKINLTQISKHKDQISNDEIEVLVELARCLQIIVGDGIEVVPKLVWKENKVKYGVMDARKMMIKA